MAYFVSLLFDFQIPTLVYLVLGLSVWLLYALDHLFDANQIRLQLKTTRHIFYNNYKKQIWVIWVFLAFVNSLIIYLYLNSDVVKFGLMLTFPVLLHFLAVKYSWFNQFSVLQKEISVAFAFCAGVILPTISLEPTFVSVKGVLVSSSIFFIALQNLLLFSIYDIEHDRAQGQKSFVVKYGIKKTNLFIDILSILNTICLVFLIIQFELKYVVFFFVLQICMSCLRFFKSYFQPNERYRWLGDMVFSLPIIYLMV